MLELRPSNQRGIAHHGWLYSRHSFSFGGYRDPRHVGFSDLLVINEDQVQPGRGFDTHDHRDMEIFSYVLDGALEHKDSMGNGSIIRPGDVQMMSAGTGIRHSEYNASSQELVHFLQIWIVPDRRGVTPRYQQRHFAPAEKRGRLRLIISPTGADDSLSVYQDARVHAGLFDGAEQQRVTLPPNRFAYVQIARGAVAVNGQRLTAGDGARLRNARDIDFSNGDNAEVLLFDLRPNELPRY
ncbi:MAG: pirin family protein [Candidatus Contendobacter sp.]|nr:pirin family protein [Candidatus Contendobacter sp.]MDG4556680.1 pirin family protein [Candidatus Contendobacter sp.]